jgi:hypothetical protein
VDFVLLLWELDRSGLQQAFGPYASQDLADEALVELGNWPSLHGAWEIMALTQAGATNPTPAPSLPYTPIVPWPPQPQWPGNGVTWCGTITAAAGHPSVQYAPGWTGCVPAATTPYMIWTTGMPSSRGDEEPPDMGVPARV